MANKDDWGGFPALSILDRRLNLATFPAEKSIYSLMRSWVKDDPTRQAPTPSRLGKRPQLSLPRPAPETDLSSATLPPKRRRVEKEQLLNSLHTVSHDVLLEGHLVHMRQVRKWWQRRRAHRYRRYVARLRAMGVPLVAQLEREVEQHE